MLVDAGIPAAPVWDLDQLTKSNHVIARDMIVTGKHQKFGDVPIVPQPVQFSEARATNKPIIPIIQNTSVDVTEDVEIIKNNLVNQVTATVRWRETMEKFKELGVDSIIEVGAGNVLTNLAKRSTPNLQRFTLNSKESLENFMRDFNIV